MRRGEKGRAPRTRGRKGLHRSGHANHVPTANEGLNGHIKGGSPVTSVRFPFNPALLVRLLILLAILLAFAAGLSAAVAPAALLTQAAYATHTQLVVGPRLPCPGLSLPC